MAPALAHPLHIADSFTAVPRMHVAKTATRSATKKAIQQRQREWLQEVVKSSGDTLAQISARSGVSDTTLSRLMNNPAYDGVLTAVTVERIAGAYRVPGPDEYAGRRPLLVGFAEAERYDPASDTADIGEIVQALLNRNGLDAWRLKSDALEAAGHLAGDILIVDINAAPQPQDVVCAQVYNWQNGGAQTVWRIFDAPFLVAAARDRTAYKPILVDNDRVVIKGVVDKMVRPTRLSATR